MSKLNESDFKDYMQKVEDEIERFLRNILEKLRTDAVGIIDANKASVSGEMRENTTYAVHKEIGKIVGVFGVSANTPHAIFKHEGTKPHWPPLLPIIKWVINKGFIHVGGKSTTIGRLRALRRNKPSEGKRQIAQIRSIGYLIARKISRKGTVGLPFLRMALNQNRSYITEELRKLQIS